MPEHFCIRRDRLQHRRKQRLLIGKHRITGFEVDRGSRGLGQNRMGCRRRDSDESAPACFPADQPALTELDIDSPGGRGSNSTLIGKLALGKQTITGPQSASTYIVGDRLRDRTIVIHGYCTEGNVPVVRRSSSMSIDRQEQSSSPNAPRRSSSSSKSRWQVRVDDKAVRWSMRNEKVGRVVCAFWCTPCFGLFDCGGRRLQFEGAGGFHPCRQAIRSSRP